MKYSAIILSAGLVATAAAKDVSVCKGTGFTECIPITSAWTCDNLESKDGRPFVSGKVTSWGSCDIFSKSGCTGISNTVDTDGWSKFPFDVLSIRC
ncbi:hypothetical protein VFPPC_14823 [Pochonia chlamydosporia 170]|uniref:CVNH domain-containing protein n=1 Tax=Pochonia chlamydosporia 170 TaxID=1380566 RepID=A0A179F4R9_METCM|nr:hypothetical protein VFPPC_14823 [Pochonia chlamydosporia 170]OAQ60360.1 hypothetical protein VFPPC_14823 [Pochonia chlamydosporia 170]